MKTRVTCLAIVAILAACSNSPADPPHTVEQLQASYELASGEARKCDAGAYARMPWESKYCDDVAAAATASYMSRPSTF